MAFVVWTISVAPSFHKAEMAGSNLLGIRHGATQ
jgi:hypothetical protein